MRAIEIKKLPLEFDFYSNINEGMKGILYHAKRDGNIYYTSLVNDIDKDRFSWDIKVSEFNRMLLTNELVVETR